jgi:RHS repeat-associated protein
MAREYLIDGDILNRMTQVGTSSQNKLTEFVYRADGLRTQKTHTVSGTSTYTHYRYDGQMGIEDLDKSQSAYLTLTRYGLGARGLDVVSRTTSSGNTVSYPLYDGHGNNVSSLLKNGASFTVTDEKTYDAWGALRSGGGTDKGKHCANLGHKQDDESGLVYMRARYYEPTSGRFVSEDGSGDGRNWYTYCQNSPINFRDGSGNWVQIAIAALAGLCFVFGMQDGYRAFMHCMRQSVAQKLANGMDATRDETIIQGMESLHGTDDSRRIDEMLEFVGGLGFAGAAAMLLGGGAVATVGGLLGTLGLAYGLGFLFGFYCGLIESAIIDIGWEIGSH